MAIKSLVCLQVIHELTTIANHSWAIFIIGTFYKMNSVIHVAAVHHVPPAAANIH